MPASNPIRPKVKAAGGATAVSAVLAYVADLAGLDLSQVPAPLLVLVGGSLASLAAFLKHDGLRGAWERIVNGDAPA